jgi:GNAT superfamily N-acetyltransferase
MSQPLKSEITYCTTRELPRDGVLVLYGACRWASAEKPDQLMAALAGSHSVVSAWDGERLVGLGNAITDGGLVVYYPHLLVHPDYQRRGIGREIMRQLVARYEGFHQHAILADSEAAPFYRECGFTEPSGVRPMWIYAGSDHGTLDTPLSLQELVAWEQHTARQNVSIILAIGQLLAILAAGLSIDRGEPILVTWPAMAFIGFGFMVASWRLRAWPTFLYGVSAPIVAGVGALVIIWIEWLARPLRIDTEAMLVALIIVYSVFEASLLVRVLGLLATWPAAPTRAGPMKWQFNLKSMLILMTACALGAALLGPSWRMGIDNGLAMLLVGFATTCLAASGVAIYRFVHLRRSV